MTTREVHIESQPREGRGGSSAAGRLRRTGLVPGVVYGGGVAPESIALDPRPLLSLLSQEGGQNSLIHLKIGSRELRRMVMLKELQYHPISGRLTHVDFARVEMNQKIAVEVPVHVVGTAAGVKNEGGLLELVHRTVRVKVLPAEIPQFVEIDVTELHTGQHVEASELKLPAGAELAMPPHETIVTVLGKSAQAEEAPGAAATTEAPAAEAPQG
jgi:large subunit ribosomal protein L25